MQRPRSPTDTRPSPSGRIPDRDHTREHSDAYQFESVTRPVHPPPKRARHRSDSPPEPVVGSATASSSATFSLTDTHQQPQLPSIRHLNLEPDLSPVSHRRSLAGSLILTQPTSQSQTHARHKPSVQPLMAHTSAHLGLGAAPTHPLSPQYAAATAGPGSGAEFLPSNVSYAPPRSQPFAGDHAPVSSPLSAPIRTPVFHQPPPHPHSAHPLSQSQPPYLISYSEGRSLMQHSSQYQHHSAYHSVPHSSAHSEARLSPGDSDPEQDQDREDGDPDSQDVQGLGHTQSIVSLGIGQEPPKKKRRRQALSCTECKRRKIKCDRHHPCGPCSRRNEPTKCQWHVIEPVDKYVTRAEWEDLYARHRSLEERYSRLESLFVQLHPDLPQGQIQPQQHIHQEVSPRSNIGSGTMRRPSTTIATLQTPISASGRPGSSVPKDSVSNRSGSAPPPHQPPAYTPTSAIPSAAPYTSLSSSSSAHPSSIPPYHPHTFTYLEHDHERDRDARDFDRERERERDRDRRTCAPLGASSTPASAERMSASSQVQNIGHPRSNSNTIIMINSSVYNTNDSESPSQSLSHPLPSPRVSIPLSPSYRRLYQTQALTTNPSLSIHENEEHFHGLRERDRDQERDNFIGQKNGPAQTSEAGDVLRARWSAQHRQQQTTYLPRFNSRKDLGMLKGSISSPLRSTPTPVILEQEIKSSPEQDRSGCSSSSESVASRQSLVRTPIPDDTEMDARIVVSPHRNLRNTEIRSSSKRLNEHSDDESISRSRTPTKRSRRASLFLSIPSSGSTPGTPPSSHVLL